MTLHTIDKDIQENMGELFNHLESSDCAIWVSTPSFAEICVPSARFNQSLLPKLEKFLFCGEILTHNLVDELFSRFPNTRLSTRTAPQATVLVTAVEVQRNGGRPASDSDRIPLPEVTFRIVDVDGKSVPSASRRTADNKRQCGPRIFQTPRPH